MELLEESRIGTSKVLPGVTPAGIPGRNLEGRLQMADDIPGG